MRRLKKAYVEITDVCNLNCTFCHGTKREKRFMTPTEFRIIAEKLRPVTDYIYLHLMGEPLLHPALPEILAICRELGFNTTVTTNGVLLPQKAEMLTGIYKISVSLHSFEANDNAVGIDEYLSGVFGAVSTLSQSGTICNMRLWNAGGKDTLNGEIEEKLHAFFTGEYKETRRGLTLCDRVYLEYGDKFDWPDIAAPVQNTVFCMGLRDQLGVLCDGTVVPCCLDADGEIALGNLLTDDIGDVLSSPRAEAIYNGFTVGSPTEELCRRCGYASQRFQNK